MSEKKQKLKTSLNKVIEKKAKTSKENPAVSIMKNRKPSPNTKKIIKSFVESLMEENKNNIANINNIDIIDNIENIDNINHFSPPSNDQINNKIKEKEEYPIKIKKDNKAKELELNKFVKKESSKSLEKIKKKTNFTTYKRNNINIVANNKIKKKNKSSVNIYINSEKKEKKNYGKIIQTEQTFKTTCNKETIGYKMIREEIAKEKKMCAEKIKIIKEHILSLQKKEEELTQKMMHLNNKENALSKKNIQNEDTKEKEISKPKNQIINNEIKQNENVKLNSNNNNENNIKKKINLDFKEKLEINEK